MPVVHARDARRTETPNAVMTTIASPTLGGASHALWHVEMEPGASGPEHAFDAEQIWTVLRGAATVELGGARHALAAGDTIVLPAGALRRVQADTATRFAALVAAPPRARAFLADGTDRGVPPWVA